MSSHLKQALDFFTEKGFVSEVDISSVMNSEFRNNLSNLLSQNNEEHLSAAIEIENIWYYYFYRVGLFPNHAARDSFFLDYFSRKNILM